MDKTREAVTRILDVFSFMQDGAFIYPFNCTPEKEAQLDDDTKRIRERYEELKWVLSFSEAMKIAKTEYMLWVLGG